jgi:pyruvate/2-oxoglutarate dehydrogenase complex dihydrolipoamide dehydrogenase (E3) component
MAQYDVAIVGSAAAGLTAAMTARRRGARVAMLESRKIGGECTHFGCVPSKSLLAVAKLAEAMRTAPRYGLPGYDPATDLEFSAVMDYVASVVEEIYLHEQPERFEDMDIDVFIDAAGARFLDPHRIQIGERAIEADHIVLSTGSSPKRVEVLGDLPLRFLDNENFWELRDAPRSVAFLGGGVIAIELGQALARLGIPVTILQRAPRIIPVADPEIAALIADTLKVDGVRIFTGAEVMSCQTLADGNIAVQVEQNHARKQLSVASVFASLGRLPNVDGLGLEAAGIKYTERGISVDEHLRTSQPHVYAAGDVAGQAQFTHVAGYQGEVAIDNILGRNRENDLSLLPWAIFTDPEVGHVGLSEDRAREQHGDIKVLRFEATADRFLTESRTDGFIKVYIDEDDQLLGADAVGTHAGEWIQYLSMAMQHQLSIEDVARTMFIYPTFAEIAKKPLTRYLRAKEPSDQFSSAAST